MKLLVVRPRLAEEVDMSRSEARMKEAGADWVVSNTADAVQAIAALLSDGVEGAQQARVRPSLAVAK